MRTMPPNTISAYVQIAAKVATLAKRRRYGGAVAARGAAELMVDVGPTADSRSVINRAPNIAGPGRLRNVMADKELQRFV